MDVGIGLPNAVPGTEGEQLVEWAKRAESAGFSSLGTIDRVAYPNYEPMVALGAAAAVTDRIGLVTSILLAPLRHSAAVLAKQAASLNALSGGRLMLGLAPGGRHDDYTAADESFEERGARFDEMLPELREIWQDDTVGPPGEPRLIVGGSVDAAYRRAAEHGEGWIMGGGTPDMLEEGRAKLEDAWSAAGRDGRPRVMALAYYSLGDEAEKAAEGYLLDYYAFLGEHAQGVAASAAKDPDTVKGYLEAFEAAGCDELLLFPCSPDPEQVDLLADAAL